MSWEDNIANGLIIVTGDGKEYRPLYKIEEITEDFNHAEFDFPNIAGTLVLKSEAKGRKKKLEFYFQGENHLDTYEEFRTSTKDKRPWKITHPMYGLIIAQAVSITYDSSWLGTTKINATLIETITEEAPKLSVVPQAQVEKLVEEFNEVSGTAFEGKLKDGSSVINLLDLNLGTIYNESEGIKKTDLQASDYFNLFTKAEAYILDVTAEPLQAITAIKDVIMYPSLFEIAVRTRINLLVSQFNSLVAEITELVSPDDKLVFENNAGNLISAMLISAATPFDDNDYGNSDTVLEISQLISDAFDTYLESLDTLSTDNGGDTNSYIPDFNSINSLSDVVDYTLSNLYNIALSAGQERIIFLEDDSNLITLTHRFYGLLADDSTIDEFIRVNKIGLSELLQIKKGRKIKYFV